MKKLTIIASFLALSATTFAQTWSVDKAHSRLSYGVTHLGIAESEGNFKAFEAKITSAKEDFSDAVIEVTVDVKSISTDNEMRDKHLQGPDFFDAEKYPTLTFKSTSFKKVGAKNYKVTGDLTLHGVTKSVVLDAVLGGTTVNPMSKKTEVGFQFTGVIKRSVFGIAAGMPAAMLGEDVSIKGNGEFVKE
ncbi:Polyisoprenoid-binding protein YceI [Chitinophaga sp. CF118]|uniref:YceI family protein n=1 Tax=Chitinophaga sp. CF118 TaxID=1884367 RepID=UPI0008E72025|nr:YceI family protein [Chitinophaga sp. CF118]SFD84905.1 Polyisoprenoid-binding protein YceI [Chitinophaga sp. CF118]